MVFLYVTSTMQLLLDEPDSLEIRNPPPHLLRMTEGLLSRNTNKMQLVIEFITPKFIEGSTCFERHTAHHEELKTVFAVSGLYTHVVTGRCPGWVGP
jgi:hypothetical protein